MYANAVCFAALREDGSVVSWGGKNVCAKTPMQLKGQVVRSIISSLHAFAALTQQGSVVTWGESNAGGSSQYVEAYLTGSAVMLDDIDTDNDGINNHLEWQACQVPYTFNSGAVPCLSVGHQDSDHDGLCDLLENSLAYSPYLDDFFEPFDFHLTKLKSTINPCPTISDRSL